MTRFTVLLPLLVVFTIWSTGITVEYGYFGFLENARDVPWGRQVLVDLVLALSMLWHFLWKDARAEGIDARPYLLLTLVAGSIGPMGYLVHRGLRRRSVSAASA